jgi:type I restriction enzyme, S subunit
MSQQELELPQGWVETELNNICNIVYGKNLSKKNMTTNGFPVFGANGIIGKYSTFHYETTQTLISCRGVNSGEVNMSPPKSYITNNSLILEILDSFLELKNLIFYQLKIINKQQIVTGSAQPQVTISNLQNFKIKLPPLNEQKRIISKIEELLSRIDSAKQSLEQTKLQLEQYRASLLKSAFEGKLTEEWRHTHDVVNLVSKLLEQNKKNSKYKIELNSLPIIPKIWAWVNFDQILNDEKNAMKAGPFGSSLKKEFYVPDGYKIYGQEQVIRGDHEYGNYFIDEKRFQLLKTNEVKAGDLLISLVGTVGKTLILPDGIKKGIINPRLIKISLDKQMVDVKFIQIYFESAPAKFYFKLASHGGTMSILNMGMLKKLPIPLPPLVEQEQILLQIKHGFSLIENTTQIVNSSLQNLQTMKMSVLKQAFEGKLVPQDPNDEPASVLLERIKSTKESQSTKQMGMKNDK